MRMPMESFIRVQNEIVILFLDVSKPKRISSSEKYRFTSYKANSKKRAGNYVNLQIIIWSVLQEARKRCCLLILRMDGQFEMFLRKKVGQ